MGKRVNCGGCGKLVDNDELQPAQEYVPYGPTKSFLGCSECRRILSGSPPVERKRYTNGQQVPESHYVCGICRYAFHESENDNLQIRLHKEDVCGEEVQPGHYVACPDCIAKFRPKVAERLAVTNEEFRKHLEKNPHLTPETACVLNWLV